MLRHVTAFSQTDVFLDWFTANSEPRKNLSDQSRARTSFLTDAINSPEDNVYGSWFPNWKSQATCDILGVTIDKELHFSKHISIIWNKSKQINRRSNETRQLVHSTQHISGFYSVHHVHCGKQSLRYLRPYLRSKLGHSHRQLQLPIPTSVVSNIPWKPFQIASVKEIVRSVFKTLLEF